MTKGKNILPVCCVGCMSISEENIRVIEIAYYKYET